MNVYSSVRGAGNDAVFLVANTSTTLNSQEATRVYLNNTGPNAVAIRVRQGGTGPGITVPANTAVTFNGLRNASQLSVQPVTSPTVSVTALSSTGTTATATCTNAFVPNDQVTISGATPAGYNGLVTVLTATSSNFTYTVASGLASATGTITATPQLCYRWEH
jgi:hypothetical protein